MLVVVPCRFGAAWAGFKNNSIRTFKSRNEPKRQKCRATRHLARSECEQHHLVLVALVRALRVLLLHQAHEHHLRRRRWLTQHLREPARWLVADVPVDVSGSLLLSERHLLLLEHLLLSERHLLLLKHLLLFEGHLLLLKHLLLSERQLLLLNICCCS